ncbi:DUF748 domain-containing protein [Pseudidiomarina sp. E22-M8]|uniref:DUF748 domain-containing protein n=1 Tax=Pseudidiomarina sp. E22-M8 TaxID=3424768 RepID=UPI00403CEDAD
MQSGSLQQFGSDLRTKWASPRRIRFWLLALVIVYTLLGFFGLPWVIRYVAVQYVAERTAPEGSARELRIASIQTNPYTLTVQLNGVELDDIDNRQLLGWDRLFVDLTWASITNRAWTFETIQLDQPLIQEERFASGESRLLRFAAAGAGEAPVTDEPAPLPALQVKQLQIVGGLLHFADSRNTVVADGEKPSQVTLALQNVGLSISDFSIQQGTPFPVHLEGQFEQGGTFKFDGTLQLLPTLAVEASASINELALQQAEPYLRQFVDVRLDSGALTLNGQFQTDAQQPFVFLGSAAVDALRIRNGLNDEALIGWQRLYTQQLEVNLGEGQIETDPIIVEGLSGRVIIYSDQSTNFGQLVKPAPVGVDSSADAGESGESRPPFSVVIESIALNDGAVDFADNSLPLPFSTRIHALKGEISTLSSSSAEPAQVKLEGDVTEFGLVNVEGVIHAWHPMRQTNVQLSFRNLQIPEYSPYTVNFAGRKIAGGTMDLDLDYRIDDGQLDGQNNLVLHDLKLGDKMASSDAMDLPLDLAIALLEDSNGVIDLTLPVSGDVGNPQFDIGKVIQQAVGTAITSVVTAPFRFLANLIGADEEDLGKVEFAAGRAELLPPQRARIGKLREALNQRPQLVLELAGPFSQSFDGAVLQREKAIAALRQRLAEDGDAGSVAEEDGVAEEPSLTAESNQAVVETMFSRLYPKMRLDVLKDYFTEESVDSAADSDGEGRFDALAYRTYLAEQVIAAQSVTETELEAVANARAEAARDALVKPDADNGIAADRVRILPPKAVDAVDGERIAMEVAVRAS